MEAGSWGQESLCQFLVHSARTLGSRAIMLNYPALISHQWENCHSHQDFGCWDSLLH